MKRIIIEIALLLILISFSSLADEMKFGDIYLGGKNDITFRNPDGADQIINLYNQYTDPEYSGFSGANCALKVDSVDGNGTVTAISILAGNEGVRYEAGVRGTHVGSGPGLGCTVNVTLVERTVGKHIYHLLKNPIADKGATIIDSMWIELDAALGTHLATTNIDKTGNSVLGSIKILLSDGSTGHIPIYAD